MATWTPVLFWILFSMTAPRTFLEGRCFFTTAPWSLCILNTKWHCFLDIVKLKGHKGAALLQAPLFFSVQFSSVQSLSRVRLSATPWIAAHQASLYITNSRSSLRLMSIESVMPSSHLTLRCPLLLQPPIPPSIRVFSNESTLRMRWPKYWSSALASFLPKKSQGWSPLEWTGWISLQSTSWSVK